jgi:hypothetical protein
MLKMHLDKREGLRLEVHIKYITITWLSWL